MLHRILAVALCALCQPSPVPPGLPTPSPKLCIAGVRGARHNGEQMSSGLSYATVLPVLAHRSLPLGTLLEIRVGGRSTRGIVLDNFIANRRLELEMSPILARRLAVLPDRVEPVTIEVVGQEPRSRWIHAIGALTP